MTWRDIFGSTFYFSRPCASNRVITHLVGRFNAMQWLRRDLAIVGSVWRLMLRRWEWTEKARRPRKYNTIRRRTERRERVESICHGRESGRIPYMWAAAVVGVGRAPARSTLIFHAPVNGDKVSRWGSLGEMEMGAVRGANAAAKRQGDKSEESRESAEWGMR